MVREILSSIDQCRISGVARDHVTFALDDMVLLRLDYLTIEQPPSVKLATDR